MPDEIDLTPEESSALDRACDLLNADPDTSMLAIMEAQEEATASGDPHANDAEIAELQKSLNQPPAPNPQLLSPAAAGGVDADGLPTAETVADYPRWREYP